MDGLAKAVSTREATVESLARAEDALERASAHAERLREGERLALAQGELRVADLHRGGAWELGVAHQRAALAGAAEAARREDAAAAEKVEHARAELAAREADAKVVEKDRDRFDARVRRAALAKEEESAAEAHAPKKP